MSRSLIAFIISYSLTRLLYWLFHFKPIEAFPVLTGLLIDFAIWVGVFALVTLVLTWLGIGRSGGRKTGRQGD
jgi:hypothetical protein